jgi:hypothetical protein
MCPRCGRFACRPVAVLHADYHLDTFVLKRSDEVGKNTLNKDMRGSSHVGFCRLASRHEFLCSVDNLMATLHGLSLRRYASNCRVFSRLFLGLFPLHIEFR